MHTDGYRGYDAATKRFALIRLYCFAHARRKFIEVIKAAGINPKKLPLKPSPPVRQALKAIEFIETRSAKSTAWRCSPSYESGSTPSLKP